MRRRQPSSRRADIAEEFAVDFPYGFPVGRMCEIHAGAHDIAQRGAGLGECLFDDFEDLAGLIFGGGLSAPTGPVPETCTVFPMRTAREKPIRGSKGELPEMFCRRHLRQYE